MVLPVIGAAARIAFMGVRLAGAVGRMAPGAQVGLSMHMDITDFIRRTNDISRRHLPQAEVWALNWTADDALESLKDRMQVRFDRPTPFTQNAFHVWRATKANRVAKVQERPTVARRHFLKVQEEGGTRPRKGIEAMLSSMASQAGEAVMGVVPTTGARLDAFGNWSSGERNQAVAGVRAIAARGGAPAGTRGRRGATYFTPAHGGLSPGIWKRTAPDSLTKVATFLPRTPGYNPQLGFMDTSGEVYRERLPINFRRALDRALATARAPGGRSGPS